MSGIISQKLLSSPATSNCFKKQHLRDESFNDLPQHPVFPKQVISHAGFYNDDGYLTCFKCGLRIKYTDLTASTFKEHKAYSAICAPFQPDTRNIEADEECAQDILEERKEIELFPMKPENLDERENSISGATTQRDKETLYRMLKRENLYLKEKTTCCSCKSEEASYLILPCGDLGACRGCIKTIEACPICTAAVMDGNALALKYESENGEEKEEDFIKKDTDIKGVQFLMV